MRLETDISHLPIGSTPLVGRQEHLDNLNAYLADPQVVVASFIAAGGVGKSALVSDWVDKIQPGYGGAQKVFGWSFYSQGTHETQTSSGPFFSAALPFFGHSGNLPETDENKASRLGELLQQQPSLLILDGMEPLQYHQDTQGGVFKDTGIYRLLRFLGGNGLGIHGQNGLVLLTSRQPIRELANRQGGRYRETLLENLTEEDGTQLLKNLGVVKGLPHEFKETVREINGYALGLILLGKLLSQQYEGDIARRDQIKYLLDEEGHGKHAKRMMAHYDEKLWAEKKSHGAFLRLLGLFDRPMKESAFEVLRTKATIATSLKKIKPPAFNIMLNNLKQAGLLLTEGSTNTRTRRWDAHPLVREYFKKKLLDETPDGYRQAHKILFEYFQSVPEDDRPNTLEKLEPLYRAMHHGCQAGEYKKALGDVYYRRILRYNEGFSHFKLGTYSSNLAALAGFFPNGWAYLPVEADLSEGGRLFLLAEAALHLASLGRMAEALGPQQEGLRMAEQMEDWKNASVFATSLCSLLFATGEFRQALKTAKKGRVWAKKSGDPFKPMILQTYLATAYHRLGELTKSQTAFQEAEKMQAIQQPEYPQLYGLPGKNYCDLLLEQARNQAEWEDVHRRAKESFQWHASSNNLLTIAMDHLTQGRALAAMGQNQEADKQSNQAVDTIRKSGMILFTPEILIHRATFLRQQKDMNSSRQDLEEALEIAVRCGMFPYEADGRLLEGHVFLDENNLEQAKKSLERAEELIEKMEYGQRIAEAHILRCRLLYKQGKTSEANQWQKLAKERIEEKGQWGLLPLLDREIH